MEKNALYLVLDELRQVRSYSAFGTMSEHIKAPVCNKNITDVLELGEQDAIDMAGAFGQAAKSKVVVSTYFRDGVMYRALIVPTQNDEGIITHYSMRSERN